MTRHLGNVLMVLTLLGCFTFPSGTAVAQTQSRDIFVSPTTGVGVGSVWGVFIGVSKYQRTELNLQFADKDAEALHAFFVTQFQGRIPADQFKLLTNEGARRGKVLRAIKEVLRRAQPEDLVILSLAMHGLLDTSGQDLYFMTHDADPNFPEDAGIGRDDVLKQIIRSKARKIVLLLDACHTGAFGSSQSLLAMRTTDTAGINRLLIAMGQAQDGLAVFSSSSAAERSQEGEKFCGGHGAFTCAVLTGLQGAADTNRNGLVELRELYDYTYRAVKTSTDGYQNPAIEGRYDNGLPLAYAAGGANAPEGFTTPGGGATAGDVARLQAELEALKRSRQDQSRVLEELKALKEQMAEMQKEPEPPPVVAKVPLYSAPQRMAKEFTGKDGAPMVLIPKGEFRMGSDQYDNEKPAHWVSLDAFYMDQYEVTTGRYATFLRATGRQEPFYWNQVSLVSPGDKPVVGVTWHDAKAYCEQYDKRLPTEAKWEKAARGKDGRTYPWGNDPPTRRHANFDEHNNRSWQGYSNLTAVGSKEAGKSPYGVYDMAGNVDEWVADWYDKTYYQSSLRDNPKGPSSGTFKVLRGGSWTYQPINVRSANRLWATPSYRNVGIGFRCAQDAMEPMTKLTPEPSPQVAKAPTHELSGYQTKLEGAWRIVNSFVHLSGFTKDQRLTALKQFQQDFPDANPHLDDVTALIQQLEQQQATEPPLIAKVPPYSAPHRLAKEITGQDGTPMVLIPKGSFLMGGDVSLASSDIAAGAARTLGNAQPVHRVYLDTFYMDQYEVTTSRYAKFFQATGREKPKYWDDVDLRSDGELPVVGVGWADANAYCKWAGKRLPTDQEWEKAARGTDGRTYPWGNTEPTADLANSDQSICSFFGFFCNVYKERLKPVNSYYAGRSPYGIYNMAGNVWEWVAGLHHTEKGVHVGNNRRVRGGSWYDSKFMVQSAFGMSLPSKYWEVYIGIRCAQDVK